MISTGAKRTIFYRRPESDLVVFVSKRNRTIRARRVFFKWVDSENCINICVQESEDCMEQCAGHFIEDIFYSAFHRQDPRVIFLKKLTERYFGDYIGKKVQCLHEFILMERLKPPEMSV